MIVRGMPRAGQRLQNGGWRMENDDPAEHLARRLAPLHARREQLEFVPIVRAERLDFVAVRLQ